MTRYKLGNSNREMQLGNTFWEYSSGNINLVIQIEKILIGTYKSENTDRTNTNREIQFGKHILENASRNNTTREIEFGKYKSGKSDLEIQLEKYGSKKKRKGESKSEKYNLEVQLNRTNWKIQLGKAQFRQLQIAKY